MLEQNKNAKVTKMVELIKTCDHYPRKFNVGHFFSSIILPPLSAGEKYKKHCSGEMGNFLLPGMVMITWGRVLPGEISKNEQIKFSDSQMHVPVILIPCI